MKRKARLAGLLSSTGSPLQYSDHQIGPGPSFYEKACVLSVEGIVSKRADAQYAPGNRGLWLKVKCVNREEFAVIGWTDPEGSRGRFSPPCCSAITIPTEGWFMPAASAPATRPN
jgi:bifunctional non-homologous end joining protein LigD